jgi:hypothetical protein
MLDTYSTIDQTISFSLKHRPYLNQHTLSKLPQTHCDAFLLLKDGQYYLVLDWSHRGNAPIALDAFLITSTGLVPVWTPQATGGIPQYWTPLTARFMPSAHKRVLQLVRDSGRGPVSLLCHYVPQADPQPLDANMYVTPVKRMGPKPGKRRVRRTLLPDIL